MRAAAAGACSLASLLPQRRPCPDVLAAMGCPRRVPPQFAREMAAATAAAAGPCPPCPAPPTATGSTSLPPPVVEASLQVPQPELVRALLTDEAILSGFRSMEVRAALAEAVRDPAAPQLPSHGPAVDVLRRIQELIQRDAAGGPPARTE
jgi:hypothetical protein